MKEDQDIASLIRRLVKPMIKIQAFAATVTSVNEDEQTVEVKTIDDGPERFDVRLTAVVKTKDTFIVAYPKVGSDVIVGIIDNNPNNCFVIQCSEITKVEWKVPETVINDGENGGLIKIEKLKADLQKYNMLWNAFFSLLNGAPIPEAGLGAPSALQLALKALFTGAQLPDYNDIENEKVKH